jgi:hypothetical protein
LAALLDLTTPARRVMLAGTWSQEADALQEATAARCLVLNAAAASYRTGAEAPDAIALPMGLQLPVGDGTQDGLAVDGRHLWLLADAARVLRPGGRVVAPVTATVPNGCRELARDAAVWVAEVDAAPPVSPPVALRRQSLPST